MLKKNFFILIIIILCLFLNSCTKLIPQTQVDSVEGIPLNDTTTVNLEEIKKSAKIIKEKKDPLPSLKNPITKDNTELLKTYITITLYDKGNEDVLNDCYALISYYENLLSMQIPTSEIYQLNHGNGKPVTLSDDTIECLKEGINYSSISENSFDVTIGQITSLWNFGEQVGIGNKPDDLKIKNFLSTVDFNNIVLDGNSVYIKNPNTYIDLGGIAKGYIADKIKDYLIYRGVESAIINLGGNVLVIGEKTNGNSFNIGIQKPFGVRSNQTISQDDQIGYIQIKDLSVVSSGVDQQYFVDADDGKVYFHILNPKTGYPVDSDLKQSTVIAKSSTECDGLSTIIFGLGSKKGMELIESLPNVECILITNDDTIIKSSGFDEKLKFISK